ncbi:adenosine receptor A2b-like [Alosa alosa]|uniref:adenosine receptor A2b-like n=1 Tax=Alosa alosa TaxID=278164 RepID=UPI0020154F83|nr:adenosine receptor A2b-like [Alosa alosa]
MQSNHTAASSHYEVLSISLMSLLAVIITVGNVLSLTVLLGSRRFRTPQGYLKVSLASADLMVGVAVVPYSVYNEVEGLMTSRGQSSRIGSNISAEVVAVSEGFQPCFVMGPVFAGCTLVSITTIFLLSLERAITVLRPLQKNMIVTKERTVGLIALTWLVCFSLALTPLLMSEDITLEFSSCSKMCNYAPCPVGQHHHPHNDSSSPVANIMLVFPIFDFAILGATCVVNAVTFSAVRRFCRARAQEAAARMPMSNGPSFSDIRAAKTICVLTGLFCASFMPMAVLVTASVLLGGRWCRFSLYTFWILTCSSSWNVLIYSARDRRFRQRALELLLGRRLVDRQKTVGRGRRGCRWAQRRHHHHPAADRCRMGGCFTVVGDMPVPELARACSSYQVDPTTRHELTLTTLPVDGSFIQYSPQCSPCSTHLLRVNRS